MAITEEEKMHIERQIKRMIRRGQVLPKYHCVFTHEEIIQRFIHAKLNDVPEKKPDLLFHIDEGDLIEIYRKTFPRYRLWKKGVYKMPIGNQSIGQSYTKVEN